MLSEHEQKIWDEIERHYEGETEGVGDGRLRKGTGAQRSGPRRDLPAVVIGGGWGALLLVLFGVPAAGVAVGAAAALIWLLWRFFPQLDGARTTDAERTAPLDEDIGAADQQPALRLHQPLRRLPEGE